MQAGSEAKTRMGRRGRSNEREGAFSRNAFEKVSNPSNSYFTVPTSERRGDKDQSGL